MQIIKHSEVRMRRKRAQILELLKEFERSKMTVRDFGKLHNISTGVLYKWKNRYQSNEKTTVGFAKVNVTPSTTIQNNLFAEVRGIRIDQVVSASFLKELLA